MRLQTNFTIKAFSKRDMIHELRLQQHVISLSGIIKEKALTVVEQIKGGRQTNRFHQSDSSLSTMFLRRLNAFLNSGVDLEGVFLGGDGVRREAYRLLTPRRDRPLNNKGRPDKVWHSKDRVNLTYQMN